MDTIMKRINLAVLLLVFIALLATAQIYKWVDDQGRVHYSDSPPPAAEAEVEEIAVEPAPPDEATREARERHEAAAQDRARREQLAESEKAAQEKERIGAELADSDLARSCEYSIRALITLEARRPVYLDSSGMFRWQGSAHSAAYKGQRMYIEDEDRPALIDQYRRKIKASCDPEGLEQRIEVTRAMMEMGM